MRFDHFNFKSKWVNFKRIHLAVIGERQSYDSQLFLLKGDNREEINPISPSS